jgi:hypothetical protein
MALIYVAGPDGLVTEAHGDSAQLLEGPAASNDDLGHAERQPATVTLKTTAGAAARFLRHGAPLTSADLLGRSSDFVRFLARLTDRTPWYTRWKSTVILEDKGSAAQGQGTIEFMDFE